MPVKKTQSHGQLQMCACTPERRTGTRELPTPANCRPATSLKPVYYVLYNSRWQSKLVWLSVVGLICAGSLLWLRCCGRIVEWYMG